MSSLIQRRRASGLVKPLTEAESLERRFKRHYAAFRNLENRHPTDAEKFDIRRKVLKELQKIMKTDFLEEIKSPTKDRLNYNWMEKEVSIL